LLHQFSVKRQLHAKQLHAKQLHAKQRKKEGKSVSDLLVHV